MTVEVHLLGHVHAVIDGRTVDPGGPRMRALLAFLALEPARPRDMGSIVDALWSTSPRVPADPREAVHTYASRLRRLLGPSTVMARGGGYALEVPAASVDAIRFERLVEGRVPTHLAPAVAERVARGIEDALELWHGEAFAGLDLPWAVAHRARLDELRSVATEHWAGARLAAGRPERVVAVLRSTIELTPQRQMSHALLATALARTGQLAEARDVLTRLRSRLDADGARADPSVVTAERGLADEGPAVAAAAARRGWEVRQHLATSPSGTVLRATHSARGTDALLKAITGARADSDDLQRAFHRVHASLAALAHPNISSPLDFWLDPGAACVVRRFYPDGHLAAESLPDVTEVRRLIAEIGDAIAVAHRAGVAHGRVRAENVFAADGTYVLADFDANVPLDDASARRDVGALARLALTTLGPPSRAAGAGARALHDVLRTAASGAQAGAGVSDLLAAIESEPRGRASAGRVPRSETPIANPYRGLRPFQESDRALFFGREALVDRIIHRIADPGAPRLVTIVGPSGSGKSSVARAGVLAALRAGAIADSHSWAFATTTPGASPHFALERALESVLDRSVTGVGAAVLGDKRVIDRALRTALPGHPQLLLLIDQFEELATTADAHVTDRVLDALMHAARAPDSRLRLLITLRSDFYGFPLDHRAMADVLEASTVVVPPLHRTELNDVVVGPATSVGVEFEPGLAERIIDDVLAAPGALPLLQFTLTQLFDRRDVRTLTHRVYADLGGVAGAVTSQAEAIHASFTEEQQRAARRCFTRIAVLSEHSGVTSRRMRVEELDGTSALEVVLERFAAARLLTFDRDPRNGAQTVEATHEALLRVWQRCRTWIESDREALRHLLHLNDAAARWQSGGDADELLRGIRLDAAIERLTSDPDGVGELVRRFIEASQNARLHQEDRERARREELERLLAEKEQERSRAEAARYAAETARLALHAGSMSGADRSLSLLLAVEAHRRSDDPTTLSALQRTLRRAGPVLRHVHTRDAVLAVRWEGDLITASTATELLTVCPDGHILERARFPPVSAPTIVPMPRVRLSATHVLWVSEDARAWIAPRADPASAVALGPAAADVALGHSSALAVVVTRDRHVSLHDADGTRRWSADGQRGGTMGALGGSRGAGDAHGVTLPWVTLPPTIGFADDDRFVVRSVGPLLELIEVTTGEVHASGSFPGVWTLGPGSWSPRTGAIDRVHGRGVARHATNDLHDVRTTPLPIRFGMQDLPVDTCALEAQRIAVLRIGGILSLTDFTSHAHREVALPTGRAIGVSASDDGCRVAVAGERGVLIVATDGSGLLNRAVSRRSNDLALCGGPDAAWIGADGDPDDPRRRGGRVWHAAPGGHWIESSDVELDGSSYLGTENTRPDLLHRYRFGDGRGGGPSGPDTMQVLRASDGSAVSVPIAKGRSMQGVGVDPLGGWIAFDSFVPHEVAVHRLSDGVELARFDSPEPAFGGVQFAVPRHGGHLLLTGLTTGRSYRLDTDTWTLAPSGLPPGAAQLACYNADGTVLLTIAHDGSLTLRDADTLGELRRLSMAAGVSSTFNTQAAAFSLDGRWLVTVHDGRGRMWDTASGELIGDPFDSPPQVAAAALPGVHSTLLTADDVHLLVWSLAPDTWSPAACAAAGRNLTHAEWVQHGPRDEPYRATTDLWPFPPL